MRNKLQAFLFSLRKTTGLGAGEGRMNTALAGNGSEI